jgi:V8-like Glu-specific endopeptidase
VKNLLIILSGLMFGWTVGTAWGGEPQRIQNLAPLRTADDSRGWEGVGRLEIAGGAFCTAALVSDTHVVTAAHCLFAAGSSIRIEDSSLVFRAGYRSGRAEAERRIRRSVVHPAYDPAAPETPISLGSDLALVELDQPIRNTRVLPFESARATGRGASVRVVSYAVRRATTPSLQNVCHVLGALGPAQVLDCDIDRGASGAPIFTVEGGVARITSIVSAKAQMGGAPVALAAPVREGLSLLREKLAASDGTFHRSRPASRTLHRDNARDLAGAKFLRP